MLQSLIGRWFGGPPPTAPKAPVEMPVSSRAASAAARQRAAEPEALPIVGARRPLIDSKGEIAGFEFHVGDAVRQRLAAMVSDKLTRVHGQALLASMRLSLGSASLAYAEIPAHWLALLPAADGAGLHLALANLAAVDDPSSLGDAIQAWRQAGARIGWRIDEVRSPGMRPDFHLCATVPQKRTVPWVAPDMPDVEAMEDALIAGAAWAGCSVRSGSEPKAVRALPPGARQLMLLLNRLVQDDDTHAVIADIKKDAALTVRLLQYMNSPGVSRGHVLGSVEQAVAVLGRAALYQWVSGQLVRMAPSRPATGTLQRMALARARLLEMAGRAAGEHSPGCLYLLGLCSVLPLLMQVSLADAVESLNLPVEAQQALLHGTGPWASYLTLVEALEGPDMAVLKIISEPLGGVEKVLAMSARAWLPE